jgi:hypothetical protein
MRLFAVAMLAFLVTAAIPFAYGLNLQLSVKDVFSADATYFMLNDTYSTLKFETEILNSGSLPFIAQARLDVQNESGTVMTAWSEKKNLMPGINSVFAFSWFPEDAGNYSARLRVYYGDEILERTLNFTVKSRAQPEDIFNITTVRAFNSRLLLSFMSTQDAGETLVMPADYPQGWTFAQAAVTAKKGQNSAWLAYMPASRSSQEINIAIASKDGRYFTKQPVTIVREGGLAAMIYNMFFGAQNYM